MRLQSKRPEEIFEPDSLKAFEQLHNHIWHRLIRVNMSLTTLEHLQAFPLDHLYGQQAGAFWHLVRWNFLHLIVVVMHTLTDDKTKKRRTHTLVEFKDRIIVDLTWIDEADRTAYIERLRALQTLGKLPTIREKISNIRHNIVAHSFADFFLVNVEGVTLLELREVYNYLERLFKALSFGTEHLMAYGDYIDRTIGGKPATSSIEEVLLLLMKDSHFVKQPDSQFWSELKKHKAPQELDLINEWREKCGLAAG